MASGWAAVQFHSRRVCRWRRGRGCRSVPGACVCACSATATPVLVLLSGIAASQAYFGAAYDRPGAVAPVVVIDPFGFGSSMDADIGSHSFAVEEHVAAVTGALRALNLDGRQLHVAGHSMGASLAIQWAAASEGDIRTVVAFDAPLYRTRAEADEQVRNMGCFEALVAADTWTGAVATLSGRRVPVLLIDGEMDPVPVRGRARALAAEFAGGTARTHRGGHDLPLASPGWYAKLLYRQITAD